MSELDESELELEFEESVDEVLAEVREVLVSRHRKYGAGNIAEFGELGLIVRLGDKMARLRNSISRDFADESVDDTVLDVIGYGLIWKLWRAGRWPGSNKKPSR